MHTPASFRPSSEPSSKAGQKLVLWIIWSAILTAVFLMRQFLKPPGQGLERSSPLDENQALQLALLLGPTMAAIAIRILWVPRVHERGKALVAMIVGLALAESLTIYGCLLAPARVDMFFATSVALILAYIPLFIRVEASVVSDTLPR
jgi:hypothetical protein